MMAPATAFSKLPSSADSSVTAFTVSFPDSDLQALQDLLKLTPIAPPSYENTLPDSDRHLGIHHNWLVEAKKYWETDFDWRKVEQQLNSFPQFTAHLSDELGDFDVHFAALFSEKPDAIPILMLHGWPGSYMEFLGILSHLQKKYTPDTLPYHIIIPSLPGYTFSKLPSTHPIPDFSQIDCARIINTLATHSLGFPSYIVQGGDVGSRVARCMAVAYPACRAIHLNFCAISPPSPDKLKDSTPISSLEQQGLKRLEEWKATGTAYAMEHATRPATIGAVLASNPIALLAWIGEKYLEWTDVDPSLQTILESVTLYWLTKCAHTNIWSYRHSYGPNSKPHDHPDWYIHKPLGIVISPKNLFLSPWLGWRLRVIWCGVTCMNGEGILRRWNNRRSFGRILNILWRL